MSEEGKYISYARRKVENELKRAEEERRRKLLYKRIEFARLGLVSYQKHKMGEAIKAFQAYIKILEELKGVGEGGLGPSHFDSKKDLSELVMISGIYWDLVKLYDQTKSQEKRKNFSHYLEKYILFSKGTPHQALCAEAIRKYMSGDKPVHRESLKNAYKHLSSNRCFIATELADILSLDTIPTLRNLRDTVLKRNSAGRWLVYHYYRKGIKIAKQLEKSPTFIRKTIGLSLDLFAWMIK